MNKAIFPAILILCLGLILGCSAADTVPVYSDPGQAINVNSGSDFVISISENSGSTGYSWRAQIDGAYLSQVSDEFKPPADPMPGKSGTKLIKFKALKTGQTKITLLLERPWEKDKPAETKVFNVTIK